MQMVAGIKNRPELFLGFYFLVLHKENQRLSMMEPQIYFLDLTFSLCVN